MIHLYNIYILKISYLLFMLYKYKSVKLNKFNLKINVFKLIMTKKYKLTHKIINQTSCKTFSH